MKLYISGAITKSTMAETNFYEAKKCLHSKGYDVISPMDFNDEGTTWETCMKRDIKALMECDGVAVLDNWQRSRGATLEVFIATQVGIQVKNLHEWEIE
jgi:hypothetical protein